MDVPALTVDRQCGSGLAAIDLAAARLRTAEGVVLAGGVESASTAPWRFWPPEQGGDRFERAPFAPAEVGDPEMGLAADLLADEFGITRERQDRYAAQSHALAVRARDAGRYEREIVPVRGVERTTGLAPVSASNGSAVRPAFRDGGTVTAGNSCGVNDGAAVVLMVDHDTGTELGLPGLRVLATATAGVDPNRPGLGLVPATRAVLDRTGLGWDDIDVVELNEAFAGQVLACCDALGPRPGAGLCRGWGLGTWSPLGRVRGRPGRAAVLPAGVRRRRPLRPGGDRRRGRPGRRDGGGAMPVIDVRSVTHLYGDRVVLDAVDAHLSERRVGVIGANGSGKSTFARLLNGLVLPDAGFVEVDGLDTRKHGKEVRRRVGFCFTDPDAQIVMPTVAEDIAFGLRRRGIAKAEVAERVERRVGAVRPRRTRRPPRPPAVRWPEAASRARVGAGHRAVGARARRADHTVGPAQRDDDRRRGAEPAAQVLLVTHHLDLLAGFDRVLVSTRAGWCTMPHRRRLSSTTGS